MERVVGFEHKFFGSELSLKIGNDDFVFDQDFIAPVKKVVFFHDFGLNVNVFGDGAGGIDFLD
jgi:hypothetical protein